MGGVREEEETEADKGETVSEHEQTILKAIRHTATCPAGKHCEDPHCQHLGDCTCGGHEAVQALFALRARSRQAERVDAQLRRNWEHAEIQWSKADRRFYATLVLLIMLVGAVLSKVISP